MKIVLPAMARSHLEPMLPAGIEPVWFTHRTEAIDATAGAQAAWIDVMSGNGLGDAVIAGTALRWVSTALAGVGAFPLDVIRQRGVVLTKGAGVNAIPVAEFAVMGMLAAAKNLPELVRAQDRCEWSRQVPGVLELFESRALIMGMGQIGRAIAARLRAFGVDVTGVRRHPGNEPGVLGPHDWRARLAEFDWIVLANALTPETRMMIGDKELRAMKPTAWLINISRGALVDQRALIEAVHDQRIAGAFLDVTDPEPAPPDDPIWSVPNIIVTAHCSGRAQTRMAERASQMFLDNLQRYLAGQPMINVVDLELGY